VYFRKCILQDDEFCFANQPVLSLSKQKSCSLNKEAAFYE
jgi:hypothetical protein